MKIEMPNLELINRAAELVRRRTETATPGVWIATPDVAIKGGRWKIERKMDRKGIPGEEIATMMSLGDGSYVSLFHPGTGRAIAIILEQSAHQYESFVVSHMRITDWEYIDMVLPEGRDIVARESVSRADSMFANIIELAREICKTQDGRIQ